MGWTRRAEGFDPSGVSVRTSANVGGLAAGRHETDGACTATTQRQEHDEQI
jgi:hypothetical protein